MLTLTTLALLGLLAPAIAHPGEDHHHEAEERAAQLASMGRRDLSHCSHHLAKRGFADRNIARRMAIARDLASVIATNHKSNLTGITPTTSPDALFNGTSQCILGPDTTEGPYYVTGELFRSNVTDGEPGVPIYLDVQILDTNTCEPLPNLALDFWHCNSTGVYSGVVASGNGNSGDAGNINATFLRGIQSTDADGVVQFQSVFPGHYRGRATHVHILAHTEGNWAKLDNNTITGGNEAAHVGQLFFDQDLISQVEAVAPYNTNTQELTQNADDNIMSQEAANIDPVVQYVLLGNSIQDGIFAWITMGVNATASKTVSNAATYGADGGIANANGGMGGPGGGMGGPPGSNGTAPPGMGGNGNASASGSAAAAAASDATTTGTSGAGSIATISASLAMMAAALRFIRL